MGAHDGRVEHLDEMSGVAHRRERVEEGFEHAGLAQPIKALPHAVPQTEPFGQSAPANILDAEEMKRFEEEPIIRCLASTTGKAGAEYRKRVRPILLRHPRRHRPHPPIASEA